MDDASGGRAPTEGRRYHLQRRVRLGDAGPHGRARLDAIARYLQDIAGEDGDDSGVGGVWVLRRTTLRFDGSWPRLGDDLDLVTFCTGAGSRWAERTTQGRSGRGGLEATAIWVLVDQTTGRPQPLPAAFHEVYGSSAQGRRVSSKLTIAAPPADAPGSPWRVRFADLDVLGHVNNARYWEAVEDVVAARGGPRIVGAVLEFRTALELHHQPEVVVDDAADAGQLRLWLRSAAGIHAACVLDLAGS